MAMHGLGVIDKTVQQTEMWVNEVAKEMGLEDKHKAFQGLRVVLHVLRDRMNLGEAANLGSQLPILLSGFYYENWKPEKNGTVTPRTKEGFLDLIREQMHQFFKDDGGGIDAEQLARAVFKVLANHVTEGEAKNVVHNMPSDVKELFPQEIRA